MDRDLVSALMGLVSLGTIITLIIVGFGQINKEMSKEYTEEVKLYSISTDKEYEGSFVLGTGNIDSREYITAYQITEDGGKKYFKMDREKTTIYETLNNNEQAYAVINRTALGVKEIKLYVPVNTIEKQINLNLQ